MRGSTARSIRQAIEYKPKNKRDYQEIEHRLMGKILQFNPETKESKLVDRMVSAYTKECISGDRKIYQFMKKKYNNHDLVQEFNFLPSEEKLEELAKEVINQERHDASQNTNTVEVNND